MCQTTTSKSEGEKAKASDIACVMQGFSECVIFSNAKIRKIKSPVQSNVPSKANVIVSLPDLHDSEALRPKPERRGHRITVVVSSTMNFCAEFQNIGKDKIPQKYNERF